jgi:hypothetical protein
VYVAIILPSRDTNGSDDATTHMQSGLTSRNGKATIATLGS